MISWLFLVVSMNAYDQGKENKFTRTKKYRERISTEGRKEQTMNRVFSVDDFSDTFWPSPPPSPPSTAPPMNRSESEWALERFLQEVSAAPVSSSAGNTNTAAPSARSQSSTSSIPPENGEDEVVEITKHPIHHRHHLKISNPHPQPLDRNLTNPIDSEEYRAFLKSKLDLACTAVAMSRESNVIKPEDLSSSLEDQKLVDGNVSLGSQAFHGGSLGIPAFPITQKKQEAQTRQTTSGSSGEDSDDDDLEGDTGTNENRGPTDAKRVRRMQSNRESARRSRRRKQAQLNERETQVGQLRDERSSLLSRFTDVNQKCDASAVVNRILKADIETLRAKVKMVEEQVKRVTGLNPVLLAGSNMRSPGMPFVGGHVDASTNVDVPMHPNPHQFFHQPIHGITPAPHLQRLNNNSFPNNNLGPLATNPQTDNGTINNGG